MDKRKNSWREFFSAIWNGSLIFLEIIVVIIKMIFAVIEDVYFKLFPKDETPVAGEIVLITGTGHGIGKELALQYAALGATVVGLDMNRKNNDATIGEIYDHGYPKAYSYICDVSKREEVFDVADKIVREVGNVTILVNNAGIMRTKSFFDHNEEVLESTFNTNVIAHFWTLQAFLPDMLKKKHGFVVAISSCSGILGIDNCSAYCASKFAVRGLMESLYNELYARNNHSGVHLTTVYPFVVDTGLCKSVRIRFTNFMPFLKPKTVAAKIITAQRRKVNEISLPEYILNFFTVMRLLPINSILPLYDFIDSGINSET